jgi:hypothetical protein
MSPPLPRNAPGAAKVRLGIGQRRSQRRDTRLSFASQDLGQLRPQEAAAVAKMVATVIAGVVRRRPYAPPAHVTLNTIPRRGFIQRI